MMVTAEGLKSTDNASDRHAVEAQAVSFEEVRGTVFVKVKMRVGDFSHEMIVTKEDLKRAMRFLEVSVTP